MNHKLTAAIAVLLLLVASLSVAGCTTQTTNNSGTATGGFMSVKITNATVPTQIGLMTTPKSGYKFVAYNATITNENATDRQVHANMFALHDSDNYVYNTDYLIQTNKSFNAFPYIYKMTQPGDKVNGIIVFEVPQNAKLTSLTYDDHSVAYNDYRGNVTVNL